MDGPIYDFYELNNQLYVAGYFTTAGGVLSPLLALWDGTNWQGTNCPFQGYASVVQEFNGLLYLGGNIYDSTIGNIDIVSWNGNSFGPVGGGILGGVSGVNALAVYHGELYVAGYFTTSAGNAGNHIMKWNGNSWADVGGGTNNEVYCLAVFNDELYVGGAFTQAGGQLINFLAKWNGIDWSPATSSVIQGPGSVDAIAFTGNAMYIGGGITQIDTVVCNNIAKYTFLTSIEERGREQFSIYPNPTSDRIIVKVNSEKLNNPTLIILNSLGETVLQSNIQVSASEFNIDLRKLPSRIYYLQIRSTDRISGCKKVIKL